MRWMGWATGVVLVVAAGVLLGVVGYTRYSSGEWRMPTGDDLVRIEEGLSRLRKHPVPHTVYLRRQAIELSGGVDDAARGVSSIVRHAGKKQVSMPGFRGSNRQWNDIVRCVQKTFEPFDIHFTDQHPDGSDYIMVVVGGRPDLIGGAQHHAGGLSPFNGEVIPRAVVFAFSDALQNRKRAICNTIAMEVGHAYGLDHAYLCSDVMTYLQDCGPKYFRNQDVPCGESKPRPCPRGEETQNSYRHLERVLGIDPELAPRAASTH